jgi:hypothetical protein
MIKAGMDTDVDLSSGVRIRARKRSFESDSILRVDVKIISTSWKVIAGARANDPRWVIGSR